MDRRQTLPELLARVLGNEPEPELQGFLRDPTSRPDILRGQPQLNGGRPLPPVNYIDRESRRIRPLPADRIMPSPRPADLPPPAPIRRTPMVDAVEVGVPFPGRIPDPRYTHVDPMAFDPADPFAPPPRRRDGPPGLMAREPMDPAPWRQPEGTPQIGTRNTPLPAGSEAPVRGMAPPDAKYQLDRQWVAANPLSEAETRPPLARGSTVPDAPAFARRPIQERSIAEEENAAWNAALASTREQQQRFAQTRARWRREGEENRRLGRGSLFAQLPRHPGR